VEDHLDPVVELRRLLVLHGAYSDAGAADELMAEGKLAEAGELYVRAAEIAPESEELLFWSGLAAASAGELDEGVARVRRAISRNRGLLELLERLGEDIAPAAPQVRAAL
jgi:tetratricopeptide (TPR) repeat protein